MGWYIGLSIHAAQQVLWRSGEKALGSVVVGAQNASRSRIISRYGWDLSVDAWVCTYLQRLWQVSKWRIEIFDMKMNYAG